MSDPFTTARELIAAGTPVAIASRMVGKSEHAVRFHLDINGCKAKTLERTRRKRAREKLHRLQHEASGYVAPDNHHKRGRRQPRPPQQANQVAVRGGTVAERVLQFVTLPQISMPMLVEVEPPRQFRLVPKIRASVNEGAERIRRIHLAMQRRGTFRSVDQVLEVRI